MVYMKRSLIVLLISALLIACFASCSPNDSALENISDSESETELQIESVSETETESVSETESESESETETEEELEKVYLPQQDIPGERLSYDVIYVERFRIGSKDQKVFRFETEAELVAFVEEIKDSNFGDSKKSALLAAVEQVDFTTYDVIAVTAQYSSSEIENNSMNGFGINEIILQDERLVFVYESLLATGANDDANEQSSFVTVKKTDVPKDVSDGLICAYSSVNPNVGSYYIDRYFEYRAK